jgi:regulator of protease activity HflC (stomatin/prohibitin superfamily)
MFREREARTLPGVPMLLFLIVVSVLSLVATIVFGRAGETGMAWTSAIVLTVSALCYPGLFVVNPNEAKVLVLFGNYAGSARRPGFHFVNPFTLRNRVSLRVRNFESTKLKVNDHTGNPIEIAAVVVWRVVDSAEAVFEVDDYKNFVHVQSEAAVRNLATSFPYDAHVEGEMALRSHPAEIADRLKAEIQDRLARAGVEVIEARISHLAYAPEIASAMLRRQQANAIVAARQRFVEGAVGMVEMALDELSRKNVVELDAERRAAMVSNLLVVLCSDQHTQPVVNTGTIYQ